jgi:predicted DNA-binding transcriptional regulator AlpA
MSQEPRKVLRKRAVLDATGWSNSTLYEKIAKGLFPAPFKPDPDGRVSCWFSDEVAAFQNRALERQIKVAEKSASLASRAM